MLLAVAANTNCIYAQTTRIGHRVTVEGKVWTERQGWNRDYMLSLDVDRLLAGFRQQAHLDTKGAALYGGWESTELRGHTLGHWLTAMSLYVSQTDDKAAASRLTYVVHSLAECQAAIGTGFLSAWDERMLDNVEDTGQGWAPYYTIHKILQGLIDAYTYTHNAEALTVAERLGDYLATRAEYIKTRNSNSTFTEKPGRQVRVSWEQALEIQETGGYPEAMLNLYALTQNDRYLSTARLFHQMSKLVPASKGIDELHTGEEHNHHHANTTIPQFIAAARDAQLKNDETMLKAAKNFWEMVVRHRTYSIGSTGHHEHWNLPPDRIIDELTPQAGETCATYNMIKLSNLLFSMEPRAEYAEYVERALCNHILSSIQPQTANFMYFHTVKPGTPRTYGSNKDIFWCCTGSGMENPGRYAESIYFEDTANNRLYVNQFIGSTMEGVVRLDSEFPAAEEATLTLLCDTTMDISIRRPSWSKGFKIRGVKGKEQDGYVTISRQWKKGDKLRIIFPMDERKEYVLGSDEVYSILHGPLVMAAKTDETPLSPEEVTLTDNFFGSVPERYDSKMEIPVYTRNQPLIPLYQLGNYRFTIYWVKY